MAGEPSAARTAGRESSVLRVFIALPLPAPARAALADVQRTFRPLVGQASWVRSDNLHLTLRFLGDQPRQRVAWLCEALARALQGRSAFQAVIAGGGCFPSSRRPQVLWAGVQAPGLAPVLADLGELLDAEGFPSDAREFTPHLTLCRLRARRPAPLPPAWERLGELARFRAEQVVLFQSELLPEGARHTPLVTVRLATG